MLENSEKDGSAVKQGHPIFKKRINKKSRFLLIDAAIAAAAAIVLFIGAVNLWRDGKTIKENIVRFHVVANSDSEEDQNLKLRVRDAVLERALLLTRAAESSEQAIGLLRKNLSQLDEAAAVAVSVAGYTYPVRVEIKNLFFPTKEYDGFALPAGDYDAVRVTIGSGGGQNFWCVLFPPLCLASAVAEGTPLIGENELLLRDGERLLSEKLSSRQVSIIKNADKKVTVRFKILDWLGELKNKFFK